MVKTQDSSPPSFEGKRVGVSSFPVKLFQILSQPAFSEIICWLPHGRSWRILLPHVLEREVIPLYFRHRSLASFMRQVNGWDFQRIREGPDRNSYYHEDFRRDRPILHTKMRRLCGPKPQRPKHSLKEPNFYNMDIECTPLDERKSKVSPSPNLDNEALCTDHDRSFLEKTTRDQIHESNQEIDFQSMQTLERFQALAYQNYFDLMQKYKYGLQSMKQRNSFQGLSVLNSAASRNLMYDRMRTDTLINPGNPLGTTNDFECYRGLGYDPLGRWHSLPLSNNGALLLEAQNRYLRWRNYDPEVADQREK